MSETTLPEIPTNGQSDELYASPPVQRVARLLRRIAEGDAVTNMARTARELGINRTTLLRLLHALEAERFIEPRAERNGWRIGVGLITLTAQAFFSDDLVQTAVPVLTRLAETLTLSAHLGVLDGREIVYLVRRVPNHAFASNIRVGSRLPAHAANMGRIILAHLPAERVERLYAGVDLRPVTPQTAVTPLQLRAQLDTDRAKGLAWSDGNYEARHQFGRGRDFRRDQRAGGGDQCHRSIGTVRRRRAAGPDWRCSRGGGTRNLAAARLARRSEQQRP